jgi:hypothetical protein
MQDLKMLFFVYYTRYLIPRIAVLNVVLQNRLKVSLNVLVKGARRQIFPKAKMCHWHLNNADNMTVHECDLGNS